jgi:uncharacterized protein (TIGR02217 family)
MSEHFIDQRMNEHISYGFTGGPTFATTRIGLVSGHERRNAERDRPKYRFRAPFEAVKPEYHRELQSNYIACRGPLKSFRFKDWSDYELDDEEVAISDGSVDEEIQIVKPYSFGPAGFEEIVERPIVKPVDSTRFNLANGWVEDAAPIAVTANDVPIGFAIDYDTGILTISAGLDDVIRVTGEFDVPVQFDEDNLDFSFENWEAHSTEIALVEDFGA